MKIKIKVGGWASSSSPTALLTRETLRSPEHVDPQLCVNVRALDGREFGQVILADLNPDFNGVTLETFQRLLRWQNEGTLQERSFIISGTLVETTLPGRQAQKILGVRSMIDNVQRDALHALTHVRATHADELDGEIRRLHEGEVQQEQHQQPEQDPPAN